MQSIELEELTAMMKQVLPYAVDAIGILAKEFILYRGRQVMVQVGSDNPSFLKGGTPSEPAHGCPYCATARQLAITHMYLLRAAAVPPSLFPVYHQLAQAAVREAIAALDTIPVQPDPQTLHLIGEVTKLDAVLSRPFTGADAQALASQVWKTIAIALALAERYNAEPSRLDSVLQSVEQRVHEVEAAVIEGEAREVTA